MYPDEFSNYFALFGQLHIEQALHVVHGISIKGFELREILTQNKFSTIGLGAAADVNSIKRARYTLQLSLCALFTMLCLRCWKMLRMKINRKFWHINGFAKNLRTMKLTCIGRW